MIRDDVEGSKPEFGDGTVHFCEDVSSMSRLTYYYHGSYPSGLTGQGMLLCVNFKQEWGCWGLIGRCRLC
jgi:hypothetical protein